MGSITPMMNTLIGGCPISSVEHLTTIEVSVTDVSSNDGILGFPGRAVNCKYMINVDN